MCDANVITDLLCDMARNTIKATHPGLPENRFADMCATASRVIEDATTGIPPLKFYSEDDVRLWCTVQQIALLLGVKVPELPPYVKVGTAGDQGYAGKSECIQCGQVKTVCCSDVCQMLPDGRVLYADPLCADCCGLRPPTHIGYERMDCDQ